MSVIMSLFLGLVQGITEFLPISSSGHLSILQNLLSTQRAQGHLLFDVFMRLSSLVSVCAVYIDEIKAMIADGLDFLRKRAESVSDEPVVLKPPARSLLFVIVGTVPMLLTVFFTGSVARLYDIPGYAGFAMIITGGVLFVSEKHIKRGIKTEKTMTLADAAFIGLSQAAAVVPGMSRTGTTIAVGLSRGLTGSFAVRFSLLLSIPALAGSLIGRLYSAIRDGIDFSYFFVYFAGFVVAAVAGFFSIQVLRRMMTKGKLSVFAYYCWAAGALTLLLSIILL